MCARHNTGCNQGYLQLPRQPHNTLVSEKCDQLCHAVIKIHTVKPTKTKNTAINFGYTNREGRFKVSMHTTSLVLKVSTIVLLNLMNLNHAILFVDPISMHCLKSSIEKKLTADYMSAR